MLNTTALGRDYPASRMSCCDRKTVYLHPFHCTVSLMFTLFSFLSLSSLLNPNFVVAQHQKNWLGDRRTKLRWFRKLKGNFPSLCVPHQLLTSKRDADHLGLLYIFHRKFFTVLWKIEILYKYKMTPKYFKSRRIAILSNCFVHGDRGNGWNNRTLIKV